MEKARIGFIGAGSFITAHHLLTVRDSDIMEVSAVCDLNESLLQKHAAAMHIGYTTRDYRDLLSDVNIDIVIIGTKQDLHAKFIIECLDAGKWVFCEKPMASNDEEIQAVLDAEKRSDGKLAVGLNRRFAPAYVETKRILRDIKKPWFVNYRLMSPNPDKRTGYYADKYKILYEGCHILHLLCWMLDSTPRRVYMTGDPYLNNCCILEYSDGSQAAFMCGSMGSLTVSFHRTSASMRRKLTNGALISTKCTGVLKYMKGENPTKRNTALIWLLWKGLSRCPSMLKGTVRNIPISMPLFPIRDGSNQLSILPVASWMERSRRMPTVRAGH